MRNLAVTFIFLVVLAALATAQPTEPPLPGSGGVQPDPGFLRLLVRDQRTILTSPARIRSRDLKWLLPLAGSAGWLLTSDQRNMRERIRTNPLARDRTLAVSNAGTGALATIPAFLYWWGWRHADSYTSETSVLTARAVVDTVLVTEGIRLFNADAQKLAQFVAAKLG